jgi:dienelactone hydrolase
MRAFANAILLGWLCVCCTSTHSQETGQTESGPQEAVPHLPARSGPYGIGRVGFDWTDSTRPERFASKPEAHRELMVYVWYPTDTKSAEARGTYLPGAKAMDAVPSIQAGMREDYGSNWPLIVSGAIVSHAVADAPMAKAPRQFPVVLLSHGMGGSGFGYTALIEHLVSHGYVVAAIDHTDSAGAVWFPDGRLVGFHRDQPAPGLSPAEQWKKMMASVGEGIEEGAADVRFVLNQLLQANEGKSVFAGRLDANRVAAMGHSAGAEFAARACELDARFKACVDLDGGMVPVAALPEYPDGATIQQPLLFLEANHDETHMGGTHEQHAEYFKKREEQLKKCPAGTYAVVLRAPGMVHGSFSDDPFLEAAAHPQQNETASHNFDLITTFVRAFLDKTLNHRTGTIYDSRPSAIPEAEVTAYGR